MGSVAAKAASNSRASDGTPPAGSVTLDTMAPLAADTLIGNGPGSAATPTAIPYVTTPTTANSVAKRDASANLAANNMLSGLATTPTAAATTTLTVTSKRVQVFTGSTTQIVALPVVSTLPQIGFSFVVINDSSDDVTVNSSGGNAVQVIAAGHRAIIFCVALTGTTAASWTVVYI